MTLAVALLAGVATLNPLRLWPGLPGDDAAGRVRLTAIGGGLVVAGLLILAALSGPILDGLDISDPTSRIAAGVAVVVIGIRDAFAGPARAEPALPGVRAAVVPVVVPHLFTPAITLLIISAAADRGVADALLVVVVGVSAVLAIGAFPVPTGPRARALWGGHVLVAGLAIALGGSLMVDGVLDI